MRAFFTCILVSILLLAPFLLVWALGVSAMNPSYHPGEQTASKIETVVVQFATQVKRQFAARVNFLHKSDEPDLGEQFLASDPGHLKERDRAIESLFSKKSGSYFTQILVENEKHPCQVDGLTLAGPYPQLVSEADRISGVDRKLSYHFQAKQHRVFHSKSGWQDWQPALPAGIDNIVLARQNGDWIVSHIPAQLSSLPGKKSPNATPAGIGR